MLLLGMPNDAFLGLEMLLNVYVCVYVYTHTHTRFFFRTKKSYSPLNFSHIILLKRLKIPIAYKIN